VKIEVVKRGRGPLVVGFHVGRVTLREACAPLGDAVALVGLSDTYGSPPSWESILASGRAAGWDGGRAVLLGWSAGAGAVRELLKSGARPEVVVNLDGGVGGWPPDPEVVRVWRELAERARRGEGLAVFSHIFQTYTERRGEKSYPATVTIVRAATGWALAEPAAGAMSERRDCGLVVLSWPSSDIDAKAHTEQHTIALPRILAEYVAPWLAARADDDTEPGSDGTGEAALEVSLRELAAGIREQPSGSNSGPRVREYLAGCVRDLDGDGDEEPLRLGAAEWCAAFVGWCDRQADIGRPWRAAVSEICRDARELGALRGVESYDPQPGDLAIFGRAGQNPLRGGLGHIARVEAFEPGRLTTVDGNHGDRVARVERPLPDPALVGWVEYPRRALAAAPLAFEGLAPVLTAVRDAEGRGATVEDFTSHPEGLP